MKKSMTPLLFSILVGGISAQPILDSDQLPHNFTLDKTIPFGCLSEIERFQGAPDTSLAFDVSMFPVLLPFSFLHRVDLRGWRIGCHEPNRSVLMFNVNILGDEETTFAPVVGLRRADSQEIVLAKLTLFNEPFLFDTLLFFPFSDSGTPELGATYVIETSLTEFSNDDYNSELFLVLDWPLNPLLEIPIPAYDPQFDAPQFEAPPLHGRFSGQWRVEGLPRQGLVLQVGETGDRNFLFAAMFTYLDGAPVWVVGNADFQPGANEVLLNMQLLEGGELFTGPLDSYDETDVTVETLGTMTIRAQSCNAISADVDFAGSGYGVASLNFERLIRIAGYDCDQTQ